MLLRTCGAVVRGEDTQSLESCPLITSPLLQEECQNYVRVLIVTGRKVFLCGTNAFSPVCSSRQVGTTRGGGGARGGSKKGTQQVLPPRHIALEWGCQI